MMDALIEKLIALLHEEIDLLVRMQGTLSIEAHAILFFNVGQIGAAREAKQALATVLQRLEQDRVALLAQLSAFLPDEVTALPLGGLLQRLPPGQAERLIPCHSRLKELLPRVQNANRSNQLLLAQALEVVQGSLALLGQTGPTVTIYHRSGALERCRPGGSVLSGAM